GERPGAGDSLRVWTTIDRHDQRSRSARGACLLRGIDCRVEQHAVSRMEAGNLRYAESERGGRNPPPLGQQAPRLSIRQAAHRQARLLLRTLPGIDEITVIR